MQNQANRMKWRQWQLAMAAVLLALSGMGLTAAESGAPPAGDGSQATIGPEQQKLWIEDAPADRHGADQSWKFAKPEYRGTVLLTQTELGGVSLATIIDKVLDQIDKQFAIKPEKSERQFVAANCMGYKVVYQATNRGSSRYQVQYFIPKNERLYILTCSCKKGTELAIDFDGLVDSFVPPTRK